MGVSNLVSMFYNAKPHIFEKAKCLRENMTLSELKLWDYLKGKKIQGLRFRAQHPIDIFIADFYCHSLKLVIEVDGRIHLSSDQREYDLGREVEISHWGIKVIRFTNLEVMEETDKVIDVINKTCSKRKIELNI